MKKESIVYNNIIFSVRGEYYSNNKEGLLHRYIWEHHNGCKIPEGYVIHHKDHNKENNDISNLILMSLSEHTSYHTKGNTYRKGTIVSPEGRENIRLSKLGNSLRKGTTTSPEGRENIRLGHIGLKHSEESKLKRSLAKRGKPSGFKYELTNEMIEDIKVGISGNKFKAKYGSLEPWRRYRANPDDPSKPYKKNKKYYDTPK